MTITQYTLAIKPHRGVDTMAKAVQSWGQATHATEQTLVGSRLSLMSSRDAAVPQEDRRMTSSKVSGAFSSVFGLAL